MILQNLKKYPIITSFKFIVTLLKLIHFALFDYSYPICLSLSVTESEKFNYGLENFYRHLIYITKINIHYDIEKEKNENKPMEVRIPRHKLPKKVRKT